ncbi:MAG: extracellular solute-binding protein [Bacteroidota bacterium]|nr:extracellular solute-binding protein [Bacteroidota bacterium]
MFEKFRLPRWRIPTLLAGLTVLSVLLAVLFALSSCSKSQKNITLRFSHFWTEPGQRAVLDSVLSDFKKENPGLDVAVLDLSWADGKTKLMINFNARTAPDVLELGSDWIAQFSSSNVLENLTNVSSLQPRFEQAPEYANEPGKWKGLFYAVPWFVDTRVLFINRDLLDQATDSILIKGKFRVDPLSTWDGMYQFGEAIQTKGVGKGIGVNGSDVHRLYKKILPQIWSNGGEILGRDGSPTFATKANIEALTFYVKQLNAGVLESQKNLDDLFKRGSLGILYSGSWLFAPLQKADFHWVCAPFPGNNGHPGISFAGGEYLAVNANSERKAESEKLVAFITRPDNELRLAKAFNIFPADKNLQQDSFYLNRNQGKVFIEQLAHARMTPVHPKWLEIEAILEDETAQALYKKKTPEEAMKSCDVRVRELLNEP